MSKVPFQFRCLQCGNCCSHLIIDTIYGRLGAFLMPEERKWFPEDKIFPMYGAGRKGMSRPRPTNVFAYQLELNVCPWLDRKDQTCMIYRNRPLTCRAFPLDSNSIMRSCKFVEAFLPDKEEIVPLENFFIRKEVAANRQLSGYIRNQLTGRESWVWPLEKRRWVPMSEILKNSFPNVPLKNPCNHLTRPSLTKR